MLSRYPVSFPAAALWSYILPVCITPPQHNCVLNITSLVEAACACLRVDARPQRVLQGVVTPFMNLLLRKKILTRSLPRVVYKRRKKDHPGDHGCIYTSNPNFISTHLPQLASDVAAVTCLRSATFVSALLAACSRSPVPCSL